VLSYAVFGKDEVLVLCFDSTVTPTLDSPPDWKDKVVRERSAQLAKSRSKSQSDEFQTVILQKPCSEQFTDRSALASCAFPRTCGDAGVCDALLATYYSLEVLRSSDWK